MTQTVRYLIIALLGHLHMISYLLHKLLSQAVYKCQVSHSNNIIVALSGQAQASALIFNLSCTHDKPKPKKEYQPVFCIMQ